MESSDTEKDTDEKTYDMILELDSSHFLHQLKSKYGNSTYDYDTLQTLLEKIWWSVYGLKNPPVVILELLISLKNEAFLGSDIENRLSNLVKTIRSIMKKQGGIASRLNTRQPTTVYLAELSDSNEIGRIDHENWKNQDWIAVEFESSEDIDAHPEQVLWNIKKSLIRNCKKIMVYFDERDIDKMRNIWIKLPQDLREKVELAPFDFSKSKQLEKY
jgi:hypothetical protein